MAGTTLAQGSSVTLTVVATDSLLIDSARSASAAVEAVSGVPGAANLQKLVNHPGGQAVYGPFGAGTVKLSAVGGDITYWQGSAPLSDEPGDVFILRAPSGAASLVDGAGISFLRGSLASGVWMTTPSIFRLRITGTGTLQMDSRDSLGNITLATFPLTSYTSETDKIEFPYAGDDAAAIRVTLTGTLTCEVI